MIEIVLAGVERGLVATVGNATRAISAVNRSSQAYHRTLQSLNGTADHFQATLGRIAGLLGGAALFNAAARSAGSFNSTIEQSRIGLAALVRNFTDLGDAPDGYSKSMEVAAQIQQQLQIEGLKTTATYEQLLVALQEGVGPAFKAGFNPRQIVEFTSLMTQAAGAISLPMDQLGQELRAILDGTIDKNARVARALGITGEKVREMTDQGRLFEYLKEQLQAFGEAGEAMGLSFTGALSNVQDAVQMALGNATENAFNRTTAFLLRLKDALVTIDAEAGTFAFNDKIVAAIGKVDAAIAGLLDRFSQDELSGIIAGLAETFGAVAVAVLQFVTAAAGLIDILGPVAPLLASVATHTLLWLAAIKATIGLPMLLYRQVMALHVGFVALTGVSLAGWLTKMRFWFATAEVLATGLQKALLRLGAATAAFAVGWQIGSWLNQFKIVQKAGVAMAAGLEKAWLRVRLAWAWATGGDTAEVRRKMAEADRIYGEMFAEIDRKAAASAAGQKKAHVEVGDSAKASAEKQAKAVAAAWTAFEGKLKSIKKELAAARAASEVSLAEQALEASRQGLEAAEAETRARAGKLSILDQEIARYQELLRLVPAAAPEGKDAEEAKAEIERTINGLRIQRLGLLKESIEAARKEGEELRKKMDDELDSSRKLAAERLRAASHERILALEIEKLESSRLPTAQARAEAELAIDRRISAERIALKQAEIAALRAIEGVDPANIIKEEQALADLRLAASRAELAGQRSIAAERLTILERSWRAGAVAVEEYQQAVKAAYDLGLMEQREFEERMVASSGNLAEALALGLSRARERMKTAAEIMMEIGDQLADRLASGLTDGFMAFVDGTKTAKEAMADFARSTLRWIAEILMKKMLLKALGFMGLGLADGGAVGAGAVKLASGGRVPGSSPNERADNIPIWGTAGEFMQPVRAVRHYGLGFMEAIRTLRLPRDLAQRMAAALPVPHFQPSFRLAAGGPVPAAAPSFRGGDTRLQVINVLAPDLVGDYLRTHSGETAIINTIRRNGSSIKAILGG